MSPYTLKDSVKETAENVTSTVKEAGRDAYDTARAKMSTAASDAVHLAREEANTRAEAGKNRVADEGAAFAGGLREVAQKPGTSSVQARLLDTVAGTVEDLSSGLRDRSVSSLVSDVETFARRHPGAFVAGSVLLGFALTRFAKASSPEVEIETPPTYPAVSPTTATRFNNNGAMS